MSEPKLCKDCGHFRPALDFTGDMVFFLARCGICEAEHEQHYNYEIMRLVRGPVEKPRCVYCTEARGSREKCGPDGKLWTPRRAPEWDLNEAKKAIASGAS